MSTIPLRVQRQWVEQHLDAIREAIIEMLEDDETWHKFVELSDERLKDGFDIYEDLMFTWEPSRCIENAYEEIADLINYEAAALWPREE